MADETNTKAAEKAKSEPAEEPRTLDVKRCDVCGRNAIDGACGHCGLGLTGTRE